MKSLHTPGPWTAELPVDVHGNQVSADLFTPEYWFISGPGADVHGLMTAADARLIAAAPDLLQELINIASAKPSTWEDPSEFKAWAQSRAQAAIVKAIGNMS